MEKKYFIEIKKKIIIKNEVKIKKKLLWYCCVYFVQVPMHCYPYHDITSQYIEINVYKMKCMIRKREK